MQNSGRSSTNAPSRYDPKRLCPVFDYSGANAARNERDEQFAIQVLSILHQTRELPTTEHVLRSQAMSNLFLSPPALPSLPPPPPQMLASNVPAPYPPPSSTLAPMRMAPLYNPPIFPAAAYSLNQPPNPFSPSTLLLPPLHQPPSQQEEAASAAIPPFSFDVILETKIRDLYFRNTRNVVQCFPNCHTEGSFYCFSEGKGYSGLCHEGIRIKLTCTTDISSLPVVLVPMLIIIPATIRTVQDPFPLGKTETREFWMDKGIVHMRKRNATHRGPTYSCTFEPRSWRLQECPRWKVDETKRFSLVLLVFSQHSRRGAGRIKDRLDETDATLVYLKALHSFDCKSIAATQRLSANAPLATNTSAAAAAAAAEASAGDSLNEQDEEEELSVDES